MPASTWSDSDTTKAVEIWNEYQCQHDISAMRGQTAGIDPSSGRVWFGESASDIWEQMEKEGIDTPLYYVRVGLDYYVRKGDHRWNE
jgi:hypothetical protein